MLRSKLDQILLSFLLLGAIVWLGGSFARALLVNDLFVTGTLEFHGTFAAAAELHSFRLIAMGGTSVMLAYVLTLLSGLAYFMRQKREWRARPWFFMSGVLVLLYVPFECAQMLYDFELIERWFPMFASAAQDSVSGSTPTVAECRKLLLQRLEFWNGMGGIFSALAGLAYFTVLILVVWRPLDRSEDVQVEAEASVPAGAKGS